MTKIKLDKKSSKKRVNEDKRTELSGTAECDGYKVMKLKCYEKSEATHYVLVKEHSVREKCPQKPESRTIFIRGVPPFVTEEGLQNAFSKFGPIQKIFFHSAPCASIPDVNTSEFFIDVSPIKGFKVAYVVYENDSSVRQALFTTPDDPLLLSPEGQSSTTLLDRLIDDYNARITTNPGALKKEVDKYMAKHDRILKMRGDSEKKQQEEEAEDGWVTVTRKTGIPRKESVHKNIMKKQDRRIKKTQLLNFYKFQIRESKMNQLVKLREKFEEDKKRIVQLKESRKFKPF